LDVMEDGIFVNPGEREVDQHTQDKHWQMIQKGVCGDILMFLSLVDRWLGCRDLRVSEYGRSSWTVYQGLYYRCLVHDTTSSLSSSHLPSAGYPHAINPTLYPTNPIVSFEKIPLGWGSY
jgi:hypothetical protein